MCESGADTPPDVGDKSTSKVAERSSTPTGWGVENGHAGTGQNAPSNPTSLTCDAEDQRETGAGRAVHKQQTNSSSKDGRSLQFSSSNSSFQQQAPMPHQRNGHTCFVWDPREAALAAGSPNSSSGGRGTNIKATTSAASKTAGTGTRKGKSKQVRVFCMRGHKLRRCRKNLRL